jgi:phosphate starvation-inducible PhoH-like protein
MTPPISTAEGQPAETRILAPTGWRELGDLRTGDPIIGSDGRPHLVTGILDRGRAPVFRVVMSDGSSVPCAEDHLWAVKTPYRRDSGRGYRLMTVREIRYHLIDANRNRKHFIPMVQPIEFPSRSLPLDPYLLGLLLGDGGLTRSPTSFSTADPELLDAVRRLVPAGITLVQNAKYDWRLSRGQSGGKADPVTTILRQMGIFGHRSEAKFIPPEYFLTPTTDRIALLQGLLDTDGSARSDNNVNYCSSSPKLALDVQALVESLGGTAPIRIRPTYRLPSHQMSIALPAGIAPFRLSRKAAIYHDRAKYPPSRSLKRIEPAGEAAILCLRTDAPDQLYVTERFIVTPNTVFDSLGRALMTKPERGLPVHPLESRTLFRAASIAKQSPIG